MSAGFDDDELEFTAVDVEPNKQNNDPPPEFTGTKLSEFKSYRKKVKLWLLFTRTSAQLQGLRVLSRLTGPAWEMPATDGNQRMWRLPIRVNMRRNFSMLWRALSMGPGRKKGERLHDCALRVQSNVRELAKQGVRLPDQVQGFLLLRRANLSTQARIAIMTLAGNSLSFGDVKKACKRHADELLRDPKDTTHAGHTRSLCHRQKKQVLRHRNRKETLTWKTPLRPWPRKATSIWKKPMFKRCCWLTKSYDRVTTVAWGTTGEPRLQTCDRAHQWRETLSS